MLGHFNDNENIQSLPYGILLILLVVVIVYAFCHKKRTSHRLYLHTPTVFSTLFDTYDNIVT